MDLSTSEQITWCPGCGNHSIFGALKMALTTVVEMRLIASLHDVVFAYGIGCHGHMVNYLNTYGFEGLHGRPIPLAEGIKLVNPRLTVCVVAGDGDTFGEGLNHFIQACRRNIDINIFVHDNRVYGLTTGQTSPTSDFGYQSKTTPNGSIESPLSGPLLALSSSATFIAQELSSDIPNLSQTLQKAILHHGVSVVNILQNCYTFNKVNTVDWYRKNTARLENTLKNRKEAISTLVEPKKIPLGIIYQERKSTYSDLVVKDKKLVEFDELKYYFL